MRLLSCLTGLLLITSAAAAQPSDNGPGPGSQEAAPGPGYDPGQAPGGAAPGYNAGGQSEQPPGGMQPQGGHRPHASLKQRFDQANVSHDGKLTLDQARQGQMGMIAKNFDQIDADHKGYITIQDIRSWHRAKHQARAAAQPQQPQQPPQ